MSESKQAVGDTEIIILKSWHLKLALLVGLIAPVVAGSGAFYGIKERIISDKAELADKVNKLELEITKTYADKETLKNLDNRMRHMEDDIVEIKTILKSKLK